MTKGFHLIEAPVAGVDGCRGGWLCVAITPNLAGAAHVTIDVYSQLKELIEATSDCAAVCLDMPIGLSVDGLRTADREARRVIGPRRSSVFPPPPRALLTVGDDYPTLNALAKAIRAGLSRQTYNLLPKMREADAALTPALQARVRESHPEVSFCALNGDCLRWPKRKREGQAERRALLAKVFGPAVRDWLPPPGAALDDLYDAAVLAWTASRVARGEAISLPVVPEYDEGGLRMEIVY
jgi:predicted RNase H-like nuclease